MRLFHLLFLAALASAEPLRPRPSPISPHISATPYTAPSACQNLAPTPVPELRLRDENVRRQGLDSLGWSDLSTCNVGVCNSASAYCTVFGDNAVTAATVVGICCNPGPACPARTTCVDLASHSISTMSTLAALYTNGTIFCGTSYPYCSSRFVEYGYGLGTFVDVDCYNSKLGELTTTVKNPSWRLYATVTNPAKGPPPSISYSSNEPSSSADISSSSTLPTSTAAHRGEKQGISTGAIAGITVGGIVAIAVCVGAIMAIRHFMRKPQQPPQQQQGMVQQGGMGYVQQPPQQQVGYGQQGGMEQQHGGVYVPQQGGTGKEAELEQPAVYTQQGQQGYSAYNAPQQRYSTLQSPQDPPPGVYQLQ